MKKTSIELTGEEAKLLKDSVDEKIKTLEKLSNACMRENLVEASKPILAQMRKLGELQGELEEIYQPSLLPKGERNKGYKED